MKIIINEKTYTKLLCEALGVPDNILNIAEEIYEKIIHNLSTFGNDPIMKRDDNQMTYDFSIKNDYKIGSKIIDKIKLSITLVKLPDIIVPEITNLSVTHTITPESNFKKNIVYTSKSTTLDLEIVIEYPTTSYYHRLHTIIEFLEEKKSELLSSLSHELMHSYERTFNTKESIIKRIEYNSFNKVRFGILPIDQFFHDLYYLTRIEQITRPSELASLMKSNEVTKENFTEFLKNNEMYEKFVRLKNFSFSNFKKSLFSEIPRIDSIIKIGRDGGNDIPEMKNDDDKVNFILLLMVNTLFTVQDNFLITILSLDNHMIQYHPDFEKRVNFRNKNAEKYIKLIENYQKYFVIIEKKINFVANKSIRKLHKLYDMAKDVKDNKKTIFDKTTIQEKNSSIRRWDSYQKIHEDELEDIQFTLLDKDKVKKMLEKHKTKPKIKTKN